MKAIVYVLVFMVLLSNICTAQPITNNTIDSNQYTCPAAQPNMLTGSMPSGGTGSYTYVWLQSTVSATTGFVAAIGTNNTQNYQPPVLSATTWYKRVVNSGAYTDTSLVVEITLLFFPPNITITSSGPTILCPGDSTTLCLSATIPGAVYQWEESPCNQITWMPITMANGPCFTTNFSTSFYCTDFNCSISFPQCGTSYYPSTITLQPSPASSTISPSGTYYLCSGNTVTLTAIANPGTYQWYLNGNPIAGATNLTYSTTTAGNYYLSVNTGTAQCNSLTTTVITTSNPSVTITPNGPTTFCQYGTLLLNSNAQPTNTIYQWSLNGSAISGATNASYAATASGSYVLNASINGCAANSNSIAVTVNPSPTVSISSLSGSNDICMGDTLHLVASPATGLSYQWINSGIALLGATNATYNTTSSGSYSVSATNSFNCASISNVIIATVHPLPGSFISSTSTHICQGSSANLLANNNAGYTYQWKKNNVIIPGATNFSYTTATAGTYKVIETTSFNCTDSSNNITLNIVPLPAPVITYTGNMTMTTGSFITYQWFINGNPIAGGTQQQFTASVGANYTVQVIDSNGCIGTSSVYVLVGIDDVSADNQSVVYPNPNHDGVFYLSPFLKKEEGTISLYNVTGQRVKQFSMQPSFNIQDLPKGVYGYRILLSKSQKTMEGKLVVE